MADSVQKHPLKFSIWKGENLFEMLSGEILTPPMIFSKFGWLREGVPLYVIKSLDGVVSEWGPLSNIVVRMGLEIDEEQYKKLAVSPVIPDERGNAIPNPKCNLQALEDLTTEFNETKILEWSRQQAKMQRIIDYSQSQLPIAAAIQGLSLQEGFASYLESMEQLPKLLEDKEAASNSEPKKVEFSIVKDE